MDRGRSRKARSPPDPGLSSNDYRTDLDSPSSNYPKGDPGLSGNNNTEDPGPSSNDYRTEDPRKSAINHPIRNPGPSTINNPTGGPDLPPINYSTQGPDRSGNNDRITTSGPLNNDHLTGDPYYSSNDNLTRSLGPSYDSYPIPSSIDYPPRDRFISSNYPTGDPGPSRNAPYRMDSDTELASIMSHYSDSNDSYASNTTWSRDHLREARLSIASRGKATLSLKLQTIDELMIRDTGVELSGPPPVYVPRRIVTVKKEVYTEEEDDETPFSKSWAEQARLIQALNRGVLGYNRLMPCMPRRRDPLEFALGAPTLPIRNPSTEMGVMIPREHFPGAEIEGLVPSTTFTPDFVVVKRHICETACPEDCMLAGGQRKKSKERAQDEVDVVPKGGKVIEDVVFSHWKSGSQNGSKYSGQRQDLSEVARLEEALEAVGYFEHCMPLEQHRLKWASEIGALTNRSRILATKAHTVGLSLKEPKTHRSDTDNPELMLRGKQMLSVEDLLEEEQQNLIEKKAKLARLKIALRRASQAGWDISDMGHETGEAVFRWLLDKGQPGAPSNQTASPQCFLPSSSSDLPLYSEEGDDSSESDLLSDDDDDDELSIDDYGDNLGTIVENLPGDESEEMPPRDEYNIVRVSTEEVPEAEYKGKKPEETGSQKSTVEEISRLEASNQDTAVEESIAEALIAQTAIARDATSPDATLQETPILDVPMEDVTAEDIPAQENTTCKKGSSRESSKKRSAKRKSPHETPFQDISEREPPALYILQKDGRLIRNPLADSHSGPQAGRRWSHPDIEAPIPASPADLEPRPRSLTVSEGAEPPAPHYTWDEILPSIEEPGPASERIGEARRRRVHSVPLEQLYADRERTLSPPPTPSLSKRPLANPEDSPLRTPPTMGESLFPSSYEEYGSVEHIEDVEHAENVEHVEHAEHVEDTDRQSIADVTSLAPARGTTPESAEMSRGGTRRRTRALSTLPEEDEEAAVDHEAGFRAMTTSPRPVELTLPFHPKRRPSLLRTEVLLVDVTSAAEELEASFAPRVPIPSRYNLRSSSSVDTESASPTLGRVFSRETSGASSGTSASASPTESDLTGAPAESSEEAVGGVSGGGAAVAETLQDLVMEGDGMDELSEPSERYREIGRGMTAEDMTDQEILAEGEGEGEPLTRMPNHQS